MKQFITIKQILAGLLLLLTMTSKAQDFIGYRLERVQSILKEEKASFILQQQEEQIKLLLVEGADISIWTFNEDSICAEHVLILDGRSYKDLHRYMRFTCWQVNEQTFINKRSKTISQINKESSVLLLSTRRFDPQTYPALILLSSDERRADR